LSRATDLAQFASSQLAGHMTADEAMAIVCEHGVVLASAKGPVPRLAECIAGESIKGSWWAHPKSHEIFAIFQEVGESSDILTCLAGPPSYRDVCRLQTRDRWLGVG
jgi:hypothetical protein